MCFWRPQRRFKHRESLIKIGLTSEDLCGQNHAATKINLFTRRFFSFHTFVEWWIWLWFLKALITGHLLNVCFFLKMSKTQNIEFRKWYVFAVFHVATIFAFHSQNTIFLVKMVFSYVSRWSTLVVWICGQKLLSYEILW